MAQIIRSKKLLLIAALILIGMTVISLTIYNTMVNKVNISVDGKEMDIRTSRKTVSEVLKDNKITLDESDFISVPINDLIKNDIKIEIRREVPVVLNYGGKLSEFNTTEQNVEKLLVSLGINYDYKDKITPSINTEITTDMEIDVVKIDEKIEIENETIPYKIVTKDNKSLDKGKTFTTQDGKEGIKEIVFKKTYENGKLISSNLVEEKVTLAPVNEIIEKGTKEQEIVIASRGTFAGKREIVMVATAYDLSYESTGKNPGDKWYGITASGTKARPGVVAVDPKVIPLGTKLYVESLDGSGSYGYAIAEDTGGAIKGNKIDLFFESSKDVKNFGRRKVKVYIIGK